MGNSTLRLDLNNHLGKMLLLDALIEISRKQKIYPKFQARYVDQSKTGEIFSDAATFQQDREGDCAMAVVWAGAYLRNKGKKVWPILTKSTNPSNYGRLHVQLYEPSTNTIIDPTRIVFRNFRNKKAAYTKPSYFQKRHIKKQLRKLFKV